MAQRDLRRLILGAVLLLAGWLGSWEGRAALVVSNFPEPESWNGLNTHVGPTYQHAVSLTTGSTAYTVDSVVFGLYSWASTPASLTEVGFFADDGGKPGTQVGANFNNPSFGAGQWANFTFTAAGSLTLQANTTYWLKISNPTTEFFVSSERSINIHLFQSSLRTPTTQAGFSYGGYQYGAGASWTPDSSSNPAFEISATAVPEPAMVGAVVGLGLCALGGWSRVRRLKAVARPEAGSR